MNLDLASPLHLTLLFVTSWLAIGAALAYVSGWRWLAARYATPYRPPGQTLAWQVYSVGHVSDSGVTGLRLSPQGLYIWASPMFRFMRPPLLIPWHEIRYGSERNILWQRTHTLRLGGEVRIRITDRALRAMEPYLADCPARLHRERGD
jgi:hypothetical protein